ncbi:hypothetical protein [Polynucleobacter sp. AP-Nino-20-G2]|uniref:hypothetical protein n=1 Tax=Polynucleobacter sp. AP-Nino-20-G2 TaxID=2576917 RepID=UPI001BFE523E|nr:hypothetical protein [Polynucleobacter sp. AP-Nino-20-G2]QWE17535.1 hypothetical protein FD960_04870 [Polynucleobacter sp. AP-Nino-20-G2]
MTWLEWVKTQNTIRSHDWFNKQDALFCDRVDSFQARGISEYEAKCIALELYLRDYDDLRLIHCLECHHLRGSFPLFDCRKGKSHQLEGLQKCTNFIPQTGL